MEAYISTPQQSSVRYLSKPKSIMVRAGISMIYLSSGVSTAQVGGTFTDIAAGDRAGIHYRRVASPSNQHE